MGATKIINVLKDDKFVELLDIVKETEASEVIFVIPRKAKAFKTEGEFSALEHEAKKDNKSITFLCSDSGVNELARRYNFDVLSAKKESGPAKRVGQTESIVATAAVKGDDLDRDSEEVDKESISEKEGGDDFEKDEDRETPWEVFEEAAEDEKMEDEAPFGTKMDDDGNIIYDEEENPAGEAASPDNAGEFQITAAASKTRGMGDIVRPKSGKNVKVVQENKKLIKLETKIGPSDLDWGNGQSDNIWSDIPKPGMPNLSFLSRFKLSKKTKSKSGLLKSGYKHLHKQWIGILFLASIIILVFIVFLTAGSAKIEIKPKADKLNSQFKISVSPNFSSVDISFNRIPGQLFTVSKSASGEFSATAEKDAVQKSRGTIIIYNEYSTSPQPLVATTRFEYIQENKESGLIFRTLQSVNVPGMTVENGIVTPGKTSVEVIADKAGQDYNVSAGDFRIMAWRERGDAARYQKIYGKSTESMRGGILGKAKVVSDFDYINAKDQLTAKVKSEINQSLKSQSAGLELLAGIEPKNDSIGSTAEIDDAAETFTMTVEGSIITIGYKKEDLMTLITQYVDRTTGLMAVPEKIELSYEDVVLNPVTDILEAAVKINGNGYAKIDTENIKDGLVGKNEVQIKNYLSSIEAIDSAKIVLSPFWVKKMPKDKGKIDISLTF